MVWFLSFKRRFSKKDAEIVFGGKFLRMIILGIDLVRPSDMGRKLAMFLELFARLTKGRSKEVIILSTAAKS